MSQIAPFLTGGLIHNAYKHSILKLRTIESFKKLQKLEMQQDLFSVISQVRIQNDVTFCFKYSVNL